MVKMSPEEGSRSMLTVHTLADNHNVDVERPPLSG